MSKMKSANELKTKKKWVNLMDLAGNADTFLNPNVEELMFESMDTNKEGVIMVSTFIEAVESSGLRFTDPRLSDVRKKLKALPRSKGKQWRSATFDKETFTKLIEENIVLVCNALRHNFLYPEFAEFSTYIEEMYEKCKDKEGGKVASYIPQLAKMSSSYWGVSVCTADGQRYSTGDTDVHFTLQSVCKPLMYALALNVLGADEVHRYVGQEPSGRIFNEVILDYDHKPHNPLINSGAIMVAAIVYNLVLKDKSAAERFEYTQNFLKRLAGGEFIGFNNSVMLSERETADRNYALAYYMREHKCFPPGTDIIKALEFYFDWCSMELTCESLAVIAGTLACGGICPITGERVLGNDDVKNVLSLMHSCGMYDYSGQFAFHAGLPAKSGVSGDMLVVVPNGVGIALWSPPLDGYGNSVRGVEFCQELVSTFNFHMYDTIIGTGAKMDPRESHFNKKSKVIRVLFSAAIGDVNDLRRCHMSRIDLSGVCDYDGRSPLHLSAVDGHLNCIRFLLETCKVTPNPKDRWNKTPLDDAKAFNQTEVVKYLEKYLEKNEKKVTEKGNEPICKTKPTQ